MANETDASDTGDSSTTDPSDTESTGEESTTPSFVVEPDVFEPFACDPFAQDCPEGEKCVAYSSTGGPWDANKCVPVTGDKGQGEPCSYGGIVEATDDCDATSHCWDVMDVDGEPLGTCREFCGGSINDPECPALHECLVNGNGSIALCIPYCDPIAQDCGEDLGCYWVGSGFDCVFATRNIPVGEPCGYINDCAPGLICADAATLPGCAGPNCCTPLCEFDGLQCEALPGTVCVPLFEPDEAPPGWEQLGTCLLP